MKFAAAVLFAIVASAADNPAAQAARSWRTAHEHAILTEFTDLLAIPNLARDSANIRRNADAITAILTKRGVSTRLLEFEGTPPVIYGEIKNPSAKRTVVFYAHYDGQPLDSKEWATEPWKPVFRNAPLDRDGKIMPLPSNGGIDPEWRLYARSASDDKAPVIAIAAALDALKAARIPIQSNIKFVFEGEEEAGSPHFPQVIERNRDLLRADVWLICDGPVDQSRRQLIAFGARGVTTIDLTVYGPMRELHSGHYGNWAPNPAMMLARLLASMKDDDGRVLVKDFYQGIEPLSDTEKRAIAEAPNMEAELKRELWLGSTEGAGKSLLDLLNVPSLNIRGMASARIAGQASNVIPATATATIDMRLVKGITPQQAVARLVDHIRSQGYFIVDHDPDAKTRMSHAKVIKVTSPQAGYRAVRTSMDLPISQAVLAAASSARGSIVKLPTMGGSVPLYAIEDILNSPTITVPIANHDNNQHAANENIRIQNLWDGIELMAALLVM